MGYCFGDGVVYFAGKGNRGTVCLYGQRDDLEKIKEDLLRIGFNSSIYSRHRHHRIDTAYSGKQFTIEYCINLHLAHLDDNSKSVY